MFYLSDGMTFEVLQSLFLQAHFYIYRSFPQLDSSNIHPLIVLNADALSFASQLFIGTETNITINKESLMHFLFYEKLFNISMSIQSLMSNKAGIYLCFPIFFSIASGTLIKPNLHSTG